MRNDSTVIANSCSIKYPFDEGANNVSDAETTDADYRERLTPDQYHVTRERGTEPAFSGIYWDIKDDGVYRCVCCEEPLFSSDTKFDSGTGWPSFWAPVDDDAVRTNTDRSHGMIRTEAVCANCDAHLGHVFPDGPNPSGDRFCMNSASLRLDRDMDPDSPDTGS